MEWKKKGRRQQVNVKNSKKNCQMLNFGSESMQASGKGRHRYCMVLNCHFLTAQNFALVLFPVSFQKREEDRIRFYSVYPIIWLYSLLRISTKKACCECALKGNWPLTLRERLLNRVKKLEENTEALTLTVKTKRL